MLKIVCFETRCETIGAHKAITELRKRAVVSIQDRESPEVVVLVLGASEASRHLGINQYAVGYAVSTGQALTKQHGSLLEK